MMFYVPRLTTEIDVGYGDVGFSFDDSGLISSNPGWKGWIGEALRRGLRTAG